MKITHILNTIFFTGFLLFCSMVSWCAVQNKVSIFEPVIQQVQVQSLSNEHIKVRYIANGPNPTPTKTPTPVPPTSTNTFSPTNTHTFTSTNTPTNIPTPVPPTPTNTFSPTNTHTFTSTNTPTNIPTPVPPTPTNTFSPTNTHTFTPTNTPTPAPPTYTPTVTNTPIPPPPTNTFTNTPIPPTPTPAPQLHCNVSGGYFQYWVTNIPSGMGTLHFFIWETSPGGSVSNYIEHFPPNEDIHTLPVIDGYEYKVQVTVGDTMICQSVAPTSTPTDTPTHTYTPTPVPPTAEPTTPVPQPTTPIPPTNTYTPVIPPTNTPVPPPPTNTPVIPPTNTPVPPTNTPIPPTNTFTPTPIPPTNTPTAGNQSSNYVLEIHSDTTHGSTFIVDSSVSQHGVGVYGNTHHSTVTQKIGGSSIRFAGSGDYLSLSDHADWNWGTNSFTVHTWVNFSSLSGEQFIMGRYQGDGAHGFGVRWTGSQLYVNVGPSWSPKFYSAGISTDTWYHIALVGINGNTVKLFLDGQQLGTDWSVNYNVNTTAGSHPLEIGRQPGWNGVYMNGYLDEIIIDNNQAIWTTNFVPPGEQPNPTITPTPIGSSSNDILVIHSDTNHGSTTVVDSSLSQHPIGVFGNTHHSTVTQKIGGSSIHFSGSGDYLSLSDHVDWNWGSNSFMVHFWVNFSILSGEQWIMGRYQGDGAHGFAIRWTGTLFQLNAGPLWSYRFYSASVNAGTWHHIAVVGENGNTIKFYFDGSQVGSTWNISYDVNASVGNKLEFGRQPGWYSYFNGYLDEIIVSQGNTPTPTPTNVPPVANDLLVSVELNTQTFIQLEYSDPDLDNTVIFTVVSNPGSGALSDFSSTDGGVNYNPNTGFVGPDSFTFKVNDGFVDSNVATVSLNVVDNSTPTPTPTATFTSTPTPTPTPDIVNIFTEANFPDPVFQDFISYYMINDYPSQTLSLDPLEFTATHARAITGDWDFEEAGVAPFTSNLKGLEYFTQLQSIKPNLYFKITLPDE